MFDDLTLAYAIAEIGLYAKMEAREIGAEAASIGATLEIAALAMPIEMARHEIETGSRNDGLHLDAVRAAVRTFGAEDEFANLVIVGAQKIEAKKQHRLVAERHGAVPQIMESHIDAITLLVDAIAYCGYADGDAFVYRTVPGWRIKNELRILGAKPLLCAPCSWLGNNEAGFPVCHVHRLFGDRSGPACASFTTSRFVHGLFSGAIGTTWPANGIHVMKPADKKYKDYNVYFAIEDNEAVAVARQGG